MTKKNKTGQIQIDGAPERYYSLADSCKILKRARSTLMRLLPAWEKVTKTKPKKDHSGRWLIPIKSVHALRDDPELYLKLAGRATKWKTERSAIIDENKQLKKKVKFLTLQNKVLLAKEKA